MDDKQPTSGQATEASPAKKGGGAMDVFKGIVIMILFLVAASAGGYFFGTYQKFAPIQYVAPGTAGAIEQTAQSQTSPSSAASSGQLKKKYWLKSSGHDHVGYAITVSVNGQLVDKFYTPDKKVEINRFVKPGENTIQFEAKALPPGMNEHKGQDYYHLDVSVVSGSYLEDPKPETLLNYKRNSAETQDYNDTLTFVTLE